MEKTERTVSPDFDLSGKVAIVTGSASGIGKATARLFARGNAKVVVADMDQAGAEQVAAEIRKNSGMALAVSVDVSDESAVQNLMERTMAEYSRLDILVNNAAFRGKADFMEMSVAQWDEMFAVTTRGTFLCMREGIKRMRKNDDGGVIVNVSSAAAQHTMIFWNAHYDAAKAGVESLTRTAAVEFAPDKIRVNCIAPGGTDTEGSRNIRNTFKPQGPAMIPGRNLMGRRAAPSELASAIYFLASPASSYMTGQVMPVDGGFLVG